MSGGTQKHKASRRQELREAWERDRRVSVGAAASLPPGFLVGHAQNANAGTGCTVVLCEGGAVGGVAVIGAAPATRETDLLRSENSVNEIHALTLSGGSAFGLDAAGGVMSFLKERGVGYAFGEKTIPIVVGASLFDFGVGDDSANPDSSMGYEAACKADASLHVGAVGAGTGATVGKMLGPTLSMKSGFGAASITKGDMVVTALVALNAFGSIVDPLDSLPLAGVLDPQALHLGQRSVLDPYRAIELFSEAVISGAARENTTIGCILTNLALTKPQANRIALTSHDAYARAIMPVHTSFDGDAIFCLSSGETPRDNTVHLDAVAAGATLAMERAIINAALAAKSGYGSFAACDLGNH